mgnify:CR=1 FL=1
MEEPDDLPDLETGGQWHQVSDCVDSGGVDHWVNYLWWSDQWDRPESEEVITMSAKAKQEEVDLEMKMVAMKLTIEDLFAATSHT